MLDEKAFADSMKTIYELKGFTVEQAEESGLMKDSMAGLAEESFSQDEFSEDPTKNYYDIRK